MFRLLTYHPLIHSKSKGINSRRTEPSCRGQVCADVVGSNITAKRSLKWLSLKHI